MTSHPPVPQTMASKILACRICLTILFPKTFVHTKTNKKPLALGIYDAIWPILKAEFPEISQRIFRATMFEYTSGVRYLKNIKTGAIRFDIHGNPAGTVLEHEAAHAAERLKKREAWINRNRSRELKKIRINSPEAQK